MAQAYFDSKRVGNPFDCDKWVFIECSCGQICRRVDGFKKHKKTEGHHEIHAKLYRCISLLCENTTEIYTDWTKFKESHRECLFHPGIEKDSAAKTLAITKKEKTQLVISEEGRGLVKLLTYNEQIVHL